MDLKNVKQEVGPTQKQIASTLKIFGSFSCFLYQPTEAVNLSTPPDTYPLLSRLDLCSFVYNTSTQALLLGLAKINAKL